MYDKLFPSKEPSVVIVVTPLKAIMKDQVSEVNKIVFTISLECQTNLPYHNIARIMSIHSQVWFCLGSSPVKTWNLGLLHITRAE